MKDFNVSNSKTLLTLSLAVMLMSTACGKSVSESGITESSSTFGGSNGGGTNTGFNPTPTPGPILPSPTPGPGTPTPAPTASPVPSPTPGPGTPTPAPTASPAPSPTPTPTPDPHNPGDDKTCKANDFDAEGGICCLVYEFNAPVARIPDYNNMTPTAKFIMKDFNVPAMSWDKGFPGLPPSVAHLRENFGLSCFSQLHVPSKGTYKIALNSDDGSILYIDDKVFIDNDGWHAPVVKTTTKALSKGLHKLRLDWYQGPRYQIALELKRQKSGEPLKPIEACRFIGY